MAISFAALRDRVQLRIRDTDPPTMTYDTAELDTAICDAYLWLQARLPSAHVYNSSDMTIAAGGDTFSLPTTMTQWTGSNGQREYSGEVKIRMRRMGLFLKRLTVDEVDSLRHGVINTLLAVPTVFCLWVEKDGTVQGRTFPGTVQGEVCDLFLTLDADDLRSYVGSGSSGLDDVQAQISRVAGGALVRYAAADLLERMSPDDIEKRKLNPLAARTWRQEATQMLYQDSAKRRALVNSGRTMRYVW